MINSFSYEITPRGEIRLTTSRGDIFLTPSKARGLASLLEEALNVQRHYIHNQQERGKIAVPW